MPSREEPESTHPNDSQGHKVSADDSNGETSSQDGSNNKPKRPTTADLLHLKEIVERGEFAGPTIIESVQCEKEMEQKAFQRLVDENVQLQRELRKAERKLTEIQHDYDVKFVELDSQKDRTEEMQLKVKDLERQLEKYRNGKNKKAEDEAEMYHDAQELSEKETIRDLQLRLTRLTNDDETKDKEIEELEKQLKIERAICEELSELVDSGKVAQIRHRHEYEAQQGKTKPQLRHNVVDSSSPQKSTVCVVM